MVGLVEKIGSATGWASLQAAGGLAGGYLFGYVYAKLSDLPAGQAAKAFAVGFAAVNGIASFARNMTEGVKHANYINAGVYTLLHSAYIYEMRRRGFMGDKLLIVSSIVLAVNIWFALFGRGIAENLSKQIDNIAKDAEKADNFETGVKV